MGNKIADALRSEFGTAGVVRAGEGETLLDGPIGAVLLAGGEATAGSVSIVIHPLAPRALGAPVHTHHNEDEWTYVLDGEVGFELGGETVTVRPGDLVLQPRGIPHAFWNAADAPARLLAMIAPGGLEGYFGKLAALFRAGAPDPAELAATAAEYGLDIDPASIPRLAQEHGLRLP